MENVPKQKFYYKLCVLVKGKLCCYMNKSIRFVVGQTITQDLGEVSPYLYVYKTPELAVTSEIGYTSKDFMTKISPKTVVKVMCWGDCIENSRKTAFNSMCIIEDIGLPSKKEPVITNLQSKFSSGLRSTKKGSPRREISPRSVKAGRGNSPTRIYTSAIGRVKSPKSQLSSNLKVRNYNSLLQKMKEETERLDQEVRDIEKWNQFLGLEETETVNSTESLFKQNEI
jgi:hypothetical protein